MALGGGMSCVKYLLFFFNLLFAITGLVILIVGIKTLVSSSAYIDITNEQFYASAPVVLIIVGIVVFVVAFFGCCGAVKENHCMIVTFSVFLLIIFVAELAVGIAGYVKHQDLETSIMKGLNATMQNYPNDPTVAKTFNVVQTDLQCCGINGPADWNNNTLPDSCCGAREVSATGVAATCTLDQPTVHKDGCYGKLLLFFKGLAFVLGGVGVGVAIVQLLGVIFACCLARSIRSQYETV